MNSQMHITIKHILKFDFYTPGNCSDVLDVLRAISPQTDAVESSKCRLECSGSLALAPSAWNLDSPLMELHLDSRALQGFWCGFSQTAEDDDEWSLQQEEIRKLIKNRESLDQLKFSMVLEILGEFEEFSCDFGELWKICYEFVRIRNIYTS